MDPGTNWELKANEPDPAARRERALGLGAVDRGLLQQRDTYFRVRSGRLKLRDEGERGEVIHYVRRDEAAARPSQYRRLVVADVEAMRSVLTERLGVVDEVFKTRRLLLLSNIRIHLDEVSGLGSFVELEAVVHRGGDPQDQAMRVRRLQHDLGIPDERLTGRGYVELLARSQTT